MSVLSTIEAKAEAFWKDVTGAAKAELEQAVADAKAELSQFEPLLSQFEADVQAAVAAAEPELKSAVASLVQTLIADAKSILSGGTQPPAAA